MNCMSICPPQSSDQVLYAGIITLYPKIIQRTRLVFPVSPGCRMTKSYHHPVCNLVIQYSARSSEGSHKLIGNWMGFSLWRKRVFFVVVVKKICSSTFVWALKPSSCHLFGWIVFLRKAQAWAKIIMADALSKRKTEWSSPFKTLQWLNNKHISC